MEAGGAHLMASPSWLLSGQAGGQSPPVYSAAYHVHHPEHEREGAGRSGLMQSLLRSRFGRCWLLPCVRRMKLLLLLQG